MLGLKCPWCFWQKSKVGGMMIKGDVKVLCVFWVLTVLLLVSWWKLFVWCLLMPNTYTIYYVFCFFGLIVGKQKLKRLKWHPHRKWKWHEFSRLLKRIFRKKTTVVLVICSNLNKRTQFNEHLSVSTIFIALLLLLLYYSFKFSHQGHTRLAIAIAIAFLSFIYPWATWN